jgi:hypothetical protein
MVGNSISPKLSLSAVYAPLGTRVTLDITVQPLHGFERTYSTRHVDIGGFSMHILGKGKTT